MTYFSVIVILIVSIVVQGFDYDNEYDWSANATKKSEAKPPSRPFQNVAITGNPQMIDGSLKYQFPSSSTTTSTTSTTTTTKRPRRMTPSSTTTSTTTTQTAATTTTTFTVPYSTKELILQALSDVIPEEDQKKFGLFTLEELQEIRKAEREEIYQALKKIVHGDQLSKNVEDTVLDGIAKLLEYNVNETAAVETTTTAPGPSDHPTTPAADLEGEAEIAQPETTTAVPVIVEDVKKLTEAEVTPSGGTGEALQYVCVMCNM